MSCFSGTGGCLTPQRPYNGEVQQFQTPNGNVALYACNRGFRLVGVTERKCVGGRWSGAEPACVSSRKNAL